VHLGRQFLIYLEAEAATARICIPRYLVVNRPTLTRIIAHMIYHETVLEGKVVMAQIIGLRGCSWTHKCRRQPFDHSAAHNGTLM
jgi:hypothetical protein